MRSARHSGVQLMCTLPASTSRANRTALRTSPVNTPAARPYRVAFARRTAVSTSGTLLTATAGPNRDAGLARVDVAGQGDRLRGQLDVGVGEDRHRTARAELERELLHARDLRDRFAGRGAAGEADLAHARIAAQRVAELPAGTG